MLQASDLIFPKGELQAVFFPNRDEMVTAVGVWLNEAYRQISTSLDRRDDAAQFWVYYRAYQAVGLRILGTPATEAYYNKVSRSWRISQSQMFLNLAEERLELYRGLTGNTDDAGPSPADAINSSPGAWDFLISNEHPPFTDTSKF